MRPTKRLATNTTSRLTHVLLCHRLKRDEELDITVPFYTRPHVECADIQVLQSVRFDLIRAGIEQAFRQEYNLYNNGFARSCIILMKHFDLISTRRVYVDHQIIYFLILATISILFTYYQQS
jgi:hypothetical protein